jgi:small-conductance mechanosensitive channel
LNYSAPGERVAPILRAAMKATPGVRKDLQPIVLIDETNDRGIVYRLNFWVSDYPEQFPVSRDVGVRRPITEAIGARLAVTTYRLVVGKKAATGLS